MKKRLLSALLALVMVLAMLPATAFAAAKDTGVAVSYYPRGQKVKEKQLDGTFVEKDIPSAGWYVTNTVTEKTGGVIAGSVGTVNTTTGAMTNNIKSGTWYPDGNTAVTWNRTTLMLLDSTTISTDKTSLTVDLNGTTGSSITMTKGGTLNIGNSNSTAATVTTLSISNAAATAAGTVTVNLGANVTASGVSLPVGHANKVNLYNGKVEGGLTMNGRGTINSKSVDSTQALTLTGVNSSVAGGVTMAGKTSTIKVSNGSIDDAVSLTGTGSSITVDNLGSVASGDTITLYGGGSLATDRVTLPKVTVDNGTVGAITRNAGFGVESVGNMGQDITLSNTAFADDITLANGNIYIANSHTENVTLRQGALNVTGAKDNGSTLVDVELGETKPTNMTVSGANVYVAKITAHDNGSIGQLNLSGVDNTYGELALKDYDSSKSNSGTGLMNGKVMTQIAIADRKWLNSSVSYQIDVNGAAGTQGYIFAGPSDFQALVDQSTKEDTDWTKCNIGHMGGAETGDYRFIVFKVEDKVVLSVLARDGAVITLPATVSNIPTTDWVDGAGDHKPAGHSYVVTGDATLSSLSTYLDVTSITKVTTIPAGIKAVVSNNGITLSGALELPGGSGSATFITLLVETNDGTVNTVTASYLYENNRGLQLTSVSPTATKGTDTGAKPTVYIDAYNNQLALQNGTKYSINGSGLRKMVDVELKGDNEHVALEVGNVTVPGYTNAASKQVLIDLIQGTTGGNTNSTDVDFTQAPAVLEGLNAVVAAMSDSHVTGWINSAQNTRFQENRRAGTETSTSLTNDMKPYENLTKVQVVAYLNMDVSIYNTDTTPGTMVMTLTPYYKVQVASTTAGIAPVVVKQGAAIPSLGTNWGDGCDVKFNVDTTFKPAAVQSWAHQGSTYVYKTTLSSNAISFKTLNGFGSFILNGVEPKVTRYENDKTTVVDYFDTLQAAVDQVEDGEHLDVAASYKPETITLKGTARKFTVNTNGAGAVVVANASGVTVDRPEANSHTYTVQLMRDNTVAVDATTATIAVNGVLNGNATVSATTAKAGTTVNVTCAPAVGYRTNSVSVSAHMTATNTNSVVSVTRVSDNVYSFKVPQGADKITVTPNFVLATVSAIPFTDVATNHWAYNSVKYVYDNGLMNGVNTAGTQFGGTQTLNRAMVVTTLYRAAGSPYMGTTSRFSDVANNTWYSQAVAWASQNNIVTGYTNGTFQPNWAITRQELATILYRYNTTYKGRATTGSTTLANFPDQGNVSDWATAGMQWAVGNGIVNGVTNGVTTTLSPAGSATRYEAATMLMRYGQGMGL